MTTYTIELPDCCPKCKRSITSLAPGGGHYAELIVAGYGGGPIPHRCPLVIIAGTEREEVTVFEVACIECVAKRQAKLVEACEKGQALLNLAEELIEERKAMEE